MPPTPRPVIDPALLNGRGAGTQWANLGFWKGAKSYPEAAAELARRVGKAAKLGPDDVVLDIACGLGDSCALYVREFGVKRVVGVEPDPAVVLEATARIKAMGLADRVVFRSERAEWLVPTKVCPGVTAVTCVDAAYHFDTRESWLTALSQDLPRGTRLALADLFFAHFSRQGRGLVHFAERAGILERNLWSAHDAEPRLHATGWRLDRLLRCGPEVLGGFARFGFRSAPRFLLRPGSGGWRALGTAAGIAFRAKKFGMDYGVIAATRL